jgi:murein L,D-transpeptidase YafK
MAAMAAPAFANGDKAPPPAAAMKNVAKHLKPLPGDLALALAERGVSPSDPIYIRVFKEESELELWKARADGTYVHVKTYPICTLSGRLGPKQRYADYQAPEGFYGFTQRLMNPRSSYHLSFDIGYPNALDRSLGRTGDLIMVHGRCKSVGCFAMTDAPMEEIYAFARDAFAGGQIEIPVHSFPFRPTEANLSRHAEHRFAATWEPLRHAFDDFEATRRVPAIAMCGQRYVVNGVTADRSAMPRDPRQLCPEHVRLDLSTPDEVVSADDAAYRRPVAAGQKMRTAESFAAAPVRRVDVTTATIQRIKARREQRAAAAAERVITADIGTGGSQ